MLKVIYLTNGNPNRIGAKRGRRRLRRQMALGKEKGRKGKRAGGTQAGSEGGDDCPEANAKKRCSSKTETKEKAASTSISFVPALRTGNLGYRAHILLSI
jgi:hypothetical protein